MGDRVCDHYDGGDHCGALTEKRYLPGWRCPAHTPAALVGRPETTPDLQRTAVGLRNTRLRETENDRDTAG